MIGMFAFGAKLLAVSIIKHRKTSADRKTVAVKGRSSGLMARAYLPRIASSYPVLQRGLLVLQPPLAFVAAPTRFRSGANQQRLWIGAHGPGPTGFRVP